MKKAVAVALVVLVPVIMFLNVWQSFRYWEVEREIRELEKVQVELFQENKLAVAGIGYLRSPYVVDDVARNVLGLEKAGTGQVIHVRIEPSGSVR